MTQAGQLVGFRIVPVREIPWSVQGDDRPLSSSPKLGSIISTLSSFFACHRAKSKLTAVSPDCIFLKMPSPNHLPCLCPLPISSRTQYKK